jgi:hypothetical protein
MAVDHYVPQFLLKNFSVDPNKPQVWAYDKSTGRSFRTNVRNIAAEKGFYRLEVGGRTLSLEEGLSTLEDKTATIIQRIIGARSIGGLSEYDRIVIAVFVAVQMQRGPNSRALTKRWARRCEPLLANADLMWVQSTRRRRKCCRTMRRPSRSCR